MKKISILLSLIILGGCKNKSDDVIYTYSMVEEYFIDSGDIFLMKEEQYYVYIFSYNCLHCQNIKSLIIKQALTHEYLIYFLHYNGDMKICGNDLELNKDFCIYGTPTLILVNNGLPTYMFVGEEQIKNYLENIK